MKKIKRLKPHSAITGGWLGQLKPRDIDEHVRGAESLSKEYAQILLNADSLDRMSWHTRRLVYKAFK